MTSSPNSVRGIGDRPRAREIDILYDITQELLAPERELEPILSAVLEHLARHLGMVRGMITIYDPAKSEIRLEASHGLSSSQRQRGRYQLGEGVIGDVIRRGEPALISCIGEEPLFLDRTQSR